MPILDVCKISETAVLHFGLGNTRRARLCGCLDNAIGTAISDAVGETVDDDGVVLILHYKH